MKAEFISRVSIGRAARSLGLTIPRFRALCERLDIKPLLRDEMIDRYREADIERLAAYLRDHQEEKP